MQRKIKVLCIVGTRPEAIKMAPVILALRQQAWVQVTVVATAQHRHLLNQVLSFFDINPDIDLDVMQPNQALSILTAQLLLKLDAVLLVEKPDIVLAQGDTTTTMVAALTCFYNKIPFGHVEAGLRTGHLDNPFPEEANRTIAGRLARLHFAPTEGARQNLLREGVDDHDIYVTGNTVIDALLKASKRAESYAPQVVPGRRLILMTAHRRENFGPPLERICEAIRIIADQRDDIEFLYPVHPNPHVKEVVERILRGHPRIVLTASLDYLPFIAAMQNAFLILTDSGGVQEEAPALGKPVLVLREETERPEAVREGVVKLVGTDTAYIVSETLRLLDDSVAYRAMARGISPYGDGKAADRIVAILRNLLLGSAPLKWIPSAGPPL
jgi:UDP-N-acetylglucosamine 2-epimerase (non-hydrolysing)